MTVEVYIFILSLFKNLIEKILVHLELQVYIIHACFLLLFYWNICVSISKFCKFNCIFDFLFDVILIFLKFEFLVAFWIFKNKGMKIYLFLQLNLFILTVNWSIWNHFYIFNDPLSYPKLWNFECLSLIYWELRFFLF